MTCRISIASIIFQMSSCQTGEVEEDTATNHLSQTENIQQEEAMEIEYVLTGDDEEEDMEVEENAVNSEDTIDLDCTKAVCHITIESKKLVIWHGSHQNHLFSDCHCHRHMRSVDHIIPILIGYHDIRIHTS